MRVVYEPRFNTLTFVLRTDAVIAESDEASPGVIIDYDDGRNIVSIEVLDASERIADVERIDFQIWR
jgi:uncharacterized protein YuzE